MVRKCFGPLLYLNQTRIHSSYEMEYLVETNLAASCVRDFEIECFWVRVLIKDRGRRLPLELQCSLYQGQQGYANQSVRETLKPVFEEDRI